MIAFNASRGVRLESAESGARAAEEALEAAIGAARGPAGADMGAEEEMARDEHSVVEDGGTAVGPTSRSRVVPENYADELAGGLVRDYDGVLSIASELWKANRMLAEAGRDSETVVVPPFVPEEVQWRVDHGRVEWLWASESVAGLREYCAPFFVEYANDIAGIPCSLTAAQLLVADWDEWDTSDADEEIGKNGGTWQ